MGLLRLLKPADAEPAVSIVAEYLDATTADVQQIRAVAVPRVSTRRPIAAAVIANVVQLTRVVETQGGQVKIFACISGRGKSLRWGPTLAIVCCSPIDTVDSSVAVVITFALQYRLLLKPHATFI